MRHAARVVSGQVVGEVIVSKRVTAVVPSGQVRGKSVFAIGAAESPLFMDLAYVPISILRRKISDTSN